MVNETKKCRLNVFWISGLTLLLVTLGITAKMILNRKLKVGKYGK